MNKLISFLTGAILGGLISAATVLLITPKSGESMRSDIEHEMEIILDEGRRAMATRRNEMEAQLGEMRGDTHAPTSED